MKKLSLAIASVMLFGSLSFANTVPTVKKAATSTTKSTKVAKKGTKKAVKKVPAKKVVATKTATKASK